MNRSGFQSGPKVRGKENQKDMKRTSKMLAGVAGLAIMAGAATVVSAQTEMPLGTIQLSVSEEEDAENPEDIQALKRSEAVRQSEQAASTYKRLRDMQYTGDTEDNIYPVGIQAAEQAMAAVRSEGADTEILDRNRAILSDLYNLLGRAAIYYSQQGNREYIGRSARAYVDVATMPEMEGYGLKRDPRLFPSVTYVAASSTYNEQNFPGALNYFETYMQTGDKAYRENVALFMAQTALAVDQPERALSYVTDAVREYPANTQLLDMAIKVSAKCGDTTELQDMLDRALMRNPNDEELLKTQALLCEQRYEFKKALDIWTTLTDMHPNSLTYNEHLAQSYYNLGVGYYNESIMSQDEKEAKKLRRQSKTYFEAAIPKLEEILANMPTSEKYLKALGVTYGCLGLTEQFNKINSRLIALGNSTVSPNQMPGMITADGQEAIGGKSGAEEIPSFAAYAKAYIEKNLAPWLERGEFETVEDYERRIASEDGANREYQRLLKQASDEYLKKYTSRLRITDMAISTYDPSNETFKVTTSYGTAVIKVPMKNKEAEMFKANWDAVQIRNPQYMIKDDRVALASITFRSPQGKSYTYNADDAADYTIPDVKVNFNDLIATNISRKGGETDTPSTAGGGTTYIGKKSDVDERIPVTSKVNDNTYVLIIANEDYQKVIDVASAYHDGDVFREYCIRTLGIPKEKVLFYPNATLNGVYEAIEILKNKVKGSNHLNDIIFYYAGHGLPDDATKSAYMLPVDANENLPKTWVPMKEVYNELTSMPNSGVMAFIDACFSGSSRSADKDGMIKEVRGIALKPRDVVPQGSGSLFVLSAAEGTETALPYKEKNHGLFTYFLLKKLQESKGNATLSEISRYVTDNVKSVSYSEFSKGQTPNVMTNGRMTEEWKSKKLK